jgi:hypothetical protein
MALSYEPINTSTDVTSTKTMLHEVIPLTGTIVSGTYGNWPDEGNIKNFSHGMFQSVYDYPYLSSSANQIFDITVGYDESSPLSSSTNTQNSKKINIYNQLSQLLLGYSTTGSGQVEIFESDLNIRNDSRQMKECVFISFGRLLTKDQIKKGTFTISLGSGSWGVPFEKQGGTGGIMTLQDLSASTDGTGIAQCIGGEYGVLYDTTGSITSGSTAAYGVVFYQAGIVALTASVWDHHQLGHGPGGVPSGTPGVAGQSWNGVIDFASGAATATGSDAGTGPARNIYESLVSSSISGTCDAIRHRIYNISFNNTTEINSTIYFCRLPVNKFNYSTNPTYCDASKMVIKNVATDMPISYVTTIGLYNSSNELMATAKLSEPLRKDPTNEMTLRVRLDY